MTIPPFKKIHGEYEDRYVAFVDILGFKKIIESSAENTNTFDTIIQALKDLSNFTLDTPISDNFSDLKAQNFSDCLVVSANYSANGLWHLLFSINDLFWRLAEFGLLLRGGVSKGHLFHDEDIVFGPALINSYYLEQNVALYPRIVVCRQVYENALSYAKADPTARAYLSTRLIQADDGPVFLHVLQDIQAFNYHGRSKSTPNSESHPTFKLGRKFCKSLRNSLNIKMDNPHIYAKLRWFAEYFDREVIADKEPEESFFEPFFRKNVIRRSCTLPFRGF